MKRREGGVPGYEPAEIYTREGSALLLPAPEVDALQVARAEAKERIARTLAAAATVDAVKGGAASSEPDAQALAPEVGDTARRRVFDGHDVAAMLEMHSNADRERLAQVKSWAKQMSRDCGYRKVLPFPRRLDLLRQQFLSLTATIEPPMIGI